MSEMQNLIEAVLNGDEDKVKILVLEAMHRKDKAGDIMNKGLIAGMDKVGEKMEDEDMFIPEVLLSAKAMSAGVEVLKPHLVGDDKKGLGTAVVGTVEGDLHDIGKNLVKMMMEGSGFTVIDLGVNVNIDKFLGAIKDNKANILGMSALLTTTMPMMKEMIESLEAEGLREQVTVLIGGAPITEGYAKEIGADGYGPDAGAAVRIAKSLIK